MLKPHFRPIRSQSHWQSFPIMALGAVLLSWPSAFLFAQPATTARTTFPLPVPYEEEAPGGPGRNVPEVNLPRPLTHTEKSQLRSMRQVALKLSRQSDDSFRRGLMPLGDHLRQLFLSYSLRQNLARMGEGESLKSLNSDERERYRDIVRQLENFNQPAAEGWAADLALANMYLARIDAESASLSGDQGRMYDALSRQAESARQHVELRRFDEFLGIAPPQAVIGAMQLERQADLEALKRNPDLDEYRTAFHAYRGQLAEMVTQVERWSNQGAGIGREDKLHLARFEVAQADAIVAAINGNDSARQSSLETADEELTNLFRSQSEFQKHGTADLFDMARTWSDRQTIYDQAADLKDFPAQPSLTTHARDFQRLEQLANQTQNRQGRIAADVEFISALKAEQDLVTLRNSLTNSFPASGR